MYVCLSSSNVPFFSLGLHSVCHLAGVFIENLQCCQPELGISDIDVLCIKMAALCHDMGHGPLSAFYQDLFMPEMHEDKFNWKVHKYLDVHVTCGSHQYYTVGVKHIETLTAINCICQMFFFSTNRRL